MTASVSANLVAALFNSTGATDPAINAVATQVTVTPANGCFALVIEHVYAPASVSAITFTVNVGTTAGTYSLNKAASVSLGAIATSFLTIEEINGTLS